MDKLAVIMNDDDCIIKHDAHSQKVHIIMFQNYPMNMISCSKNM